MGSAWPAYVGLAIGTVLRLGCYVLDALDTLKERRMARIKAEQERDMRERDIREIRWV